MEKFAEYGFNKSHSAAYGLITIHTAWLKAHYPVEFMAALLTSEKDNTDKVVAHIAEAREQGIEVLPPDVNESRPRLRRGGRPHPLRPRRDQGRGRVGDRGDHRGARANGAFKDLFDFCERVDSRRVNKKVVEALVKAGAFDFEKRPRRQLFETIERAIERGASSQRDKAVGQASLFGMFGGGGAAPALKNEYAQVEEWSEKERLSFEKESIGFYVSGHPLDQYEKELRRYARPCAAVKLARRDEKVTVAGIVAQLRERPTKTGKRMAWVTLEDLTGSIELVCFPGREAGRSMQDKNGRWTKGGAKPGYDNWETMLKGDEPLLVTGAVQINQRDEDAPVAELVVEEIQSLREVREKRVKRLEIRLSAGQATEERLQRLAEIASKYVGATPLAVALTMPGEAEALIGSTRFKVSVTDELLEAVNRLFGSRVAELG